MSSYYSKKYKAPFCFKCRCDLRYFVPRNGKCSKCSTVILEYDSDDFQKLEQEVHFSAKMGDEVANMALILVNKLRDDLKAVRREINTCQIKLAEKNRELDALGYVWCSGGCEGGACKHNPGKINSSIITKIVNNTERLVTWWANQQYRKINKYAD